jgi:hypothetical protein
LLALALGTLLAVPATNASAAQVNGDFDGDGRADLAVGLEGQDVGGAQFAGAVQVIYGSRHGLSGRGDRVFTQNSRGVKESAETGDGFGVALATGDFDRDGRDDLAVGVPFEGLGGHVNAGVVHILYGSRRGLRGKGSKLLKEGKRGVKGSAADSNAFGWSVGVANFGRSRSDDLAIGAFDRVSGHDDAGAVDVLYGSKHGLRAKGSKRFTQDSPSVPDAAEDGEQFGSHLAVADLGHDHHADLAVGARYEDVGAVESAGSVTVLYGSKRGLRAKRSQRFTEDTPGIAGTAAAQNDFGWALAADDMGRSKRADLAVAAPFEDVDGTPGAGAVSVLYGSRGGLRALGSQRLTQETPGQPEGVEAQDDFGRALAAGNLGRGKRADLAVGTPSEDLGVPPDQIVNAGAVNVVYGTGHGLTASGERFLAQDTPGIQDAAEDEDQFGLDLTIGRFRGWRVADLAIGVPLEDVAAQQDVGAVNVLRGSRHGVKTSGDKFLRQGSGGLKGTPELGDLFGAALSGRNSGVVFD